MQATVLKCIFIFVTDFIGGVAWFGGILVGLLGPVDFSLILNFYELYWVWDKNFNESGNPNLNLDYSKLPFYMHS
jgi:hypothetical protein